MLSEKVKQLVHENGFAELVIADGTEEGYRFPSTGCSMGCSFAKCSLTEVFAGTDEAWARFLQLEGGAIQY